MIDYIRVLDYLINQKEVIKHDIQDSLSKLCKPYNNIARKSRVIK